MVPEAPLERTDAGLVPAGDGWFVVNAREARWFEDAAGGAYTRFEGDEPFAQLGIGIGVLWPGQSAGYYHREDQQEDFLILSGECLLLVEGTERLLRAWDFVHCPPWTEHVFVAVGDGPSAMVAVGRRPTGDVVYAASELAQRHGAGVERQTTDPGEAYASLPRPVPVACREAWLPS